VSYTQVPEEGNDAEFDRIWSVVDANGEGTVELDEFVAFMAQEAAGAESASELLEAFKILASGRWNGIVTGSFWFRIEARCWFRIEARCWLCCRILTKDYCVGQPFVLATDLQRELSPELYEYCMQHMAPHPDGPEGKCTAGTASWPKFAVVVHSHMPWL
jgi:hypothetical protein